MLSKQPAGSIPACAGEPLTAVTTGVMSQVYPRVCGGTSASVMVITSPVGLSPRVRGNPAPLPGSFPF